jgi:hypothetical protein
VHHKPFFIQGCMNKEKEKKSDEWVLIVNRTGE